VIGNAPLILEFMSGFPPLKPRFSFFRSPMADSFLSRFNKLFPTFPIPPVQKNMNNQSEIVYPNDIARSNPRVSHRMPIRIKINGRVIKGCTQVVSAFGATVEIEEDDYKFLMGLEILPKVMIQTSLILSEAECNGISQSGNKFLLGIKLANDFTWYGQNS
jgi:hypothetical protein